MKLKDIGSFSGWLLIITSIIITFILRIKNYHLTEGELLVNFWHLWLSVIFCALSGLFFIIFNE